VLCYTIFQNVCLINCCAAHLSQSINSNHTYKNALSFVMNFYRIIEIFNIIYNTFKIIVNKIINNNIINKNITGIMLINNINLW